MSLPILDDDEFIADLEYMRALSVAVLTAVAYTNPERGTE